MVRTDLAAGIPYKDASGRFFDFHALRHSFIALLDRSGATLKEAMHHPTFWWICFGHTSALFVVQAVNVHLISDLTHSLHYSEASASLVLVVCNVTLTRTG